MSGLTDAMAQIGDWLDRTRQRRAEADESIRRLLTAVNLTRAYIGDWESGTRDRARELAIVQAWTDAAVAVRRYDVKFAQQLEMKAQYWTDPTSWTREDVLRAGIPIKDVAARAR